MSDIRLVASTIPTRQTADNNLVAARGLRDGSLVTMDQIQALIFEGRGFMLQIGDESVGVAGTTVIADTLVWMLVDVPLGTTIFPFYAQARIDTWTTSVAVEYMIEVDNAAIRFSSGGTAFTPLNLRTNTALTSTCAGRVGTDITASAKSGSGSLELYRHSHEVLLGASGDPLPDIVYDPSSPLTVIGPASVLVHLGSTTADVTAFGSLHWAEVPTNSIV